jgi:hypothetical protein
MEHIDTDRQADDFPKERFSYSRSGRGAGNVYISTSICFITTRLSHIYYILAYEEVNITNLKMH